MEELTLAVVIFLLRVLNYSVGTIRLVAITRGLRFLASILAMLEALIFAVVIANVVSDLENIVNLTSYCLGAGVGSYVGMMLEARFVTGYSVINIISGTHGHELAVALREAGYGVTETTGQGREGSVSTLRSVINKRDIPRVTKMAQEINPDSFITIEDARTVQRGWLRAPMPGRERNP